MLGISSPTFKDRRAVSRHRRCPTAYAACCRSDETPFSRDGRFQLGSEMTDRFCEFPPLAPMARPAAAASPALWD